MGSFAHWLPDVLRAAGVDVYVMPGAETRTTRSSGLTPLGLVWHHTATGPNWNDDHVAFLLRDGRRDLPGPLSQVGIERDGTWVIVALGRANHNGYGSPWRNDSIGLEFYNSGTGEPWPADQVRSGIVGTAAILRHLGKGTDAVMGHKETDPNRKIDPHGLDMREIRRRINAYLTGADQEDDMPLNADDKAWLRNLATEIAGNKEAVADWDHHYGQKGSRRTLVRWTGEAVTLLRQNTVDRVVAGVLAGIEAGEVDEAVLRSAVKAGVDDAMRDAFDAS